MTAASERLLELSTRLTALLVEHTAPAAVLVAGSVAEGVADDDSDIDLIVYYEALPSPEAVQAFRDQAQAGGLRPLGPRLEHMFIESFRVEAVEVQLAASTLTGARALIDSVLVEHDLERPSQKALSGLLGGRVLHGEKTIDELRSLLVPYPESLRKAMIEKHLRLFPAWAFTASWYESRDAELFRQRMVLDGAFAVLGALAGLNGVYYSAFQLKHLSALVDSFTQRPADLHDRLVTLVARPAGDGLEELRRLVTETVDLIAAGAPGVDLSTARAMAGIRLGGR